MTEADLPKVVVYTKTATDDLQFNLTIGGDQKPIWLREANIHCLTNNALYGDVYDQPAAFNTGDVISFQDFNLTDLWFKNATAGSNTVIRCVGVVMSAKRRRELGI